jgi:hypothetical protein
MESFTYTPAPAPVPEPTPFTFADDVESLPPVDPRPEEVESSDLDIPAFLRPRKRIF